MTLIGREAYIEGTNLELTAVLNEEVVTPESTDAFTWFKDGVPIEDSTEEYLTLAGTEVSDSGVYSVTVPVEWLLDPEDNTTIILSASTSVQINLPVPVIGGIMCLMVLLCLIAGVGSLFLFLHRKEQADHLITTR